MIIKLPFPPSVNHYWRRVDNRTIVSARGRQYQEQVAQIVEQSKAAFGEADLVVSIIAHPPDARRRDLDNLLKAPLDAMARAGLYADDSQIREIHLSWGGVVANGSLEVDIQPQEGPQHCDTSDLAEELHNQAKRLRDELDATLAALDALSQSETG